MRIERQAGPPTASNIAEPLAPCELRLKRLPPALCGVLRYVRLQAIGTALAHPDEWRCGRCAQLLQINIKTIARPQAPLHLATYQ